LGVLDIHSPTWGGVLRNDQQYLTFT
jgi:hypothetical protein